MGELSTSFGRSMISANYSDDDTTGGKERKPEKKGKICRKKARKCVEK